jgi:hypothetical protein
MQAYYEMVESENAVICLPSLSLGRLLGEALSTRERKCTGQRYRKWSQRCDVRLSFLRVSSCRQREKAPEVVPPAMQADLAILPADAAACHRTATATALQQQQVNNFNKSTTERGG